MPVARTPASPEDRILAAIRAISPGHTSSYGEIARRAGLPRRARLVAKILSGNDDPTLPWHRVLRADGRIAFAPGSRGFREQCARLRREGVKVENGRVRLRASGDGIDALLWGPGD
ncbi:MAG: MGMT family protein [Chiayiivirga sp.]|jgi:methylated-DNA-protein-cysteine methyltransferase-like protein|nr:MGMT family protein [Chiayiivirga sp.]